MRPFGLGEARDVVSTRHSSRPALRSTREKAPRVHLVFAEHAPGDDRGSSASWFRTFFEIDESRLRVRVYLHDGLDLEAAERFWSDLTGVPRSQFRAPYRAKADPTMRLTKHEYGCAYVRYSCSRTHREVMGLVRALLTSGAIPG